MFLMGILWIFWALSLQPKGNSQALTDGYTCVTDYWSTISCSLPVTSIRNKNTSYCLEFYWINYENPIIFKCHLQRASDNYSCSITVQNGFIDIDHFKVTLYCQNMSSLMDSSFYPAKNIKPNAPYNLTVQYANGSYNFIWKSGYEDHEYQTSIPFGYNFLFYKDGHYNNSVKVHEDKTRIQIPEAKLDPNSTYTAMVRTGINKERSYNGMWSEWSTTIKWQTRHREVIVGSNEPSQIGTIAVGICLMIGLLILLLSVPVARMKIKEIAWVPTPEAYFQPLYKHYQGNFQCWVLAQSPIQDVHVMEEFSPIDKIDEIITMLQDQGEKMNMFPPTQCHTPYVGPTVEVWAPRQTFDTCSETSIPFEEFSLFCEALPKVDDLIQCLSTSCLTENGLSLQGSVLSHVSLESLENDTETPEAPVIINPMPVCFKQDYCTLTDTPTGPVPIFTRDVKLDEDTHND